VAGRLGQPKVPSAPRPLSPGQTPPLRRPGVVVGGLGLGLQPAAPVRTVEARFPQNGGLR